MWLHSMVGLRVRPTGQVSAAIGYHKSVLHQVAKVHILRCSTRRSWPNSMGEGASVVVMRDNREPCC